MTCINGHFKIDTVARGKSYDGGEFEVQFQHNSGLYFLYGPPTVNMSTELLGVRTTKSEIMNLLRKKLRQESYMTDICRLCPRPTDDIQLLRTDTPERVAGSEVYFNQMADADLGSF